ncbi:MAG TPA: DUF58 domain-containing protein, partial [Mycobacterium sp.]
MTAAGSPDGEVFSTPVELRWRASPLTRSIATCAAVAIACALLTGRAELVAFAAPLLGVLCSLGWQRPVPTVEVHGHPGLQRCFESEQVRVTVSATADDGGVVGLYCSVLPGMEIEAVGGTKPAGSSVTVAVQAPRWGRYPISAAVR